MERIRYLNKLMLMMLVFFGLSQVKAQDCELTASRISDCSPLSVDLSVNTSLNFSNIVFDYGDGTTVTGSLTERTRVYDNNSDSNRIINPRAILLDANGDTLCIAELDDPLTVFANPTAGIELPAETNFCYSDQFGIQFRDDSEEGSAPLVEWSWFFGDGSGSSDVNPFHVYDVGGRCYTASLEIVDDNGCSDFVEAPDEVCVTPEINLDFRTNYILDCPTTDVDFINNSQTGGITSFEWIYFGGLDGNEGDTLIESFDVPGGIQPGDTNWTNFTKTYGEDGEFNISLVVTQEVSGLVCNDTLTRVGGAENMRIDLNITSDPDQICFGDQPEFSFQQTPAYGDFLALLWDFGDPDNPMSIDDENFATSYTYTGLGTFDVSFLVVRPLQGGNVCIADTVICMMAEVVGPQAVIDLPQDDFPHDCLEPIELTEEFFTNPESPDGCSEPIELEYMVFDPNVPDAFTQVYVYDENSEIITNEDGDVVDFFPDGRERPCLVDTTIEIIDNDTFTVFFDQVSHFRQPFVRPSDSFMQRNLVTPAQWTLETFEVGNDPIPNVGTGNIFSAFDPNCINASYYRNMNLRQQYPPNCSAPHAVDFPNFSARFLPTRDPKNADNFEDYNVDSNNLIINRRLLPTGDSANLYRPSWSNLAPPYGEGPGFYYDDVDEAPAIARYNGNFPYASDSLEFFWNFADFAADQCTSTVLNPVDTCNFSTEVTPRHLYTEGGCFTASLTVFDPATGCEDEASITIFATPPRAGYEESYILGTKEIEANFNNAPILVSEMFGDPEGPFIDVKSLNVRQVMANACDIDLVEGEDYVVLLDEGNPNVTGDIGPLQIEILRSMPMGQRIDIDAELTRAFIFFDIDTLSFMNMTDILQPQLPPSRVLEDVNGIDSSAIFRGFRIAGAANCEPSPAFARTYIQRLETDDSYFSVLCNEDGENYGIVPDSAAMITGTENCMEPVDSNCDGNIDFYREYERNTFGWIEQEDWEMNMFEYGYGSGGCKTMGAWVQTGDCIDTFWYSNYKYLYPVDPTLIMVGNNFRNEKLVSLLDTVRASISGFDNRKVVYNKDEEVFEEYCFGEKLPTQYDADNFYPPSCLNVNDDGTYIPRLLKFVPQDTTLAGLTQFEMQVNRTLPNFSASALGNYTGRFTKSNDPVYHDTYTYREGTAQEEEVDIEEFYQMTICHRDSFEIDDETGDTIYTQCFNYPEYSCPEVTRIDSFKVLGTDEFDLVINECLNEKRCFDLFPVDENSSQPLINAYTNCVNNPEPDTIYTNRVPLYSIEGRIYDSFEVDSIYSTDHAVYRNYFRAMDYKSIPTRFDQDFIYEIMEDRQSPDNRYIAVNKDPLLITARDTLVVPITGPGLYNFFKGQLIGPNRACAGGFGGGAFNVIKVGHFTEFSAQDTMVCPDTEITFDFNAQYFGPVEYETPAGPVIELLDTTRYWLDPIGRRDGAMPSTGFLEFVEFSLNGEKLVSATFLDAFGNRVDTSFRTPNFIGEVEQDFIDSILLIGGDVRIQPVYDYFYDADNRMYGRRFLTPEAIDSFRDVFSDNPERIREVPVRVEDTSFIPNYNPLTDTVMTIVLVDSSLTHRYLDTGNYDVFMRTFDSNGCEQVLRLPEYISVVDVFADFLIEDSINICAPQTINLTNLSVGLNTRKTNYRRTTINFFSNQELQQLNQEGFTPETMPDTVRIFRPDGTVANTIPRFRTEVFDHPVFQSERFLDSTTGTYRYRVTNKFETESGAIAVRNRQVLFGDTRILTDTIATAGNNGYYWNFGGPGTNNEGFVANPVFRFATNDTFDIKLVVQNNIGCMDSIINPVDSVGDTAVRNPLIFLGPKPMVEVIEPEGCDPFTVCFKDFSDVNTLEEATYSFIYWRTDVDNPDTIRANDFSGTQRTADSTFCIDIPEGPGEYEVQLTLIDEVTDGGVRRTCEAIYPLIEEDTTHRRVIFRINAIDSADFEAPIQVCADEIFELDAGAGGRLSAEVYTRFDWFISNGDTLTGSNPSYSFPSELGDTSFTITMIPSTDSAHCPDTVTREIVVVDPLPVALYDSARSGEGRFEFNHASEFVENYTWIAYEDDEGNVIKKERDYEDSSSANNFNVDYETDTGTFMVVLIGESGECQNVDTLFIQNTYRIEKYVPNVFSPNGDGANDELLITIEGEIYYDLTIFNRWGRKVFESSDKEIVWDGTNMNDGSTCTEGTYYYVFSYQFRIGERQTESGTITLFR